MATYTIDEILNKVYDSTNEMLKITLDGLTVTNDGTKTTLATTAGDYFRIGDAGTTSRSLASEDDLMVTGKLEVDGITYLDSVAYIGDNANANATLGLTINQAGNDDEILALKSSDVAHGVTTYAETDTFASLRKTSAANGGLQIRSLLASGSRSLHLIGVAPTDDTTKSTAADAYIFLEGLKTNGTGVQNPGATANIVAIRGNDNVCWLAGKNGDTWQSGRITTGGTTPTGFAQNAMMGNFTSDGADSYSVKQTFDGILTGASGDTSYLVGTYLFNQITTQTATEDIGYVAQLALYEPRITKNLTGNITVASTLYISGAPTEGTTNAAIYVASGATMLAGTVTATGAILSGAITTTSYAQFTEMTAPGAGAANTARVYALEGAGDALTDLCAVFQDGTIDVFAQEATEPDSPIFQFPDSTEVKTVMRKPDRKTIQFVAKFPDGRDFVMREIRYPVERW